MAAVNAQPDVERTARADRRGGATPTSRAAAAACSRTPRPPCAAARRGFEANETAPVARAQG